MVNIPMLLHVMNSDCQASHSPMMDGIHLLINSLLVVFKNNDNLSSSLLLLVNEVLYLDVSCRRHSAPEFRPQMVINSLKLICSSGCWLQIQISFGRCWFASVISDTIWGCHYQLLWGVTSTDVK